MIPDTIKTAIYEKKELHLKLLSDFNPGEFIDVALQPYILGEDVLEIEFIWGYIKEKDIFYKIPTILIATVELSEIPFKSFEKKTFNKLIIDNYSGFLEGFNIKDSDSSGVTVSEILLLNLYKYLSLHN